MKKFFLVVLSLILVFTLSSCGAKIDALDSSNTEMLTVVIEPGSTAVSIGEQLQSNGLILDAKAFKKYAKSEGYDVKFQAGTYQLSPSYDLEQICDILVGGKIAVNKFTIPEGLTLKETAKKLSEQGIGTYENYLEVFEHVDDFKLDYDFLNEPEINSLEGFLYPNTYEIPIGYTEKQVVDFLLQQYKKYVHCSYKQLIVASIIEREAKHDDERPLVASVIYNRLGKNMNLEMCSTVQYILLETTGEVHDPLLFKDLEIESPYNTYKNGGLPIGPICSPGLASIKAAIDPADTDYMYFVVSSDLDGSMKFSSNYKDFANNVNEYDKAKSNQ